MKTVGSFPLFYQNTAFAFLSSTSVAPSLAAAKKRFQKPRWSCSSKVSNGCVSKSITKQKVHKELTSGSNQMFFLQNMQLLGIVPFIPNWILLALYGYLGFRFFSGFEQTTYSKNSRLLLSILWPVMFIANDRFRQNFKKALKQGEDEDR